MEKPIFYGRRERVFSERAKLVSVGAAPLGSSQAAPPGVKVWSSSAAVRSRQHGRCFPGPSGGWNRRGGTHRFGTTGLCGPAQLAGSGASPSVLSSPGARGLRRGPEQRSSGTCAGHDPRSRIPSGPTDEVQDLGRATLRGISLPNGASLPASLCHSAPHNYSACN